MKGNGTISKVIPEGEHNCIWAEAGLVSYKLCDRNYECDDCPFDQVMRQKSPPVSVDVKVHTAGRTRSRNVRQGTLSEVVRGIFGDPFSEKLPRDRSYSRGHVWIMKDERGAVRLGIDHYVAGLLEGIASIVFPEIGASAVRDNPCAWIICEGGTIAVQSPVDGRLRCINPRLVESAATVGDDPYESGWLAEISCPEKPSENSIEASVMESESKSQFANLEREIIEEFDAEPSTLGVTLMDGGNPPHSLKDVLGTARYISFLQRLFAGRT